MHRLLAFLAIMAILVIAGPPSTVLTAARAADKNASSIGPELHSRLRNLGSAVSKTGTTTSSLPARVPSSVAESARERARALAGRSAVGKAKRADLPSKGTPRFDPAAHPPSRDLATKVAGDGFVGRKGTGLGDIYEVEPNDVTAQGLDDLPVNVVGGSGELDDIDYYAITATQGESIRIEVVADRVFGTLLDSYLVVFDDHGNDPIAVNDDYFDGSSDSFIRLIAPDAGTHVYYIGVTDFGGLGGDGYEYVLNLTVADSPDDVEQESNDTTTLADVVTLPSLYFGLSDVANDIDVIRFDALGGNALIVDVDAEVFLSDMDPVVEIFDNHGGYLFGNDDADGLDSRFNMVLPYTGTYYVAVYDAQNRGGGSFYYSVNLSLQDASLAPIITGFKIQDGSLLKRVLGSNFVAVGGSTRAEVNGVIVPSKPAPKKPTKVVKLVPLQPVRRGDVVTVVNPDGRRSNPGVIN